MSDYPAGKRELQADFVGVVGPGLSITKRPDAISFDFMTAFCQGPVAIGDTTQGVINFVWRVRTDGLHVWVARGSLGHTWEAETLLFTTTGELIQEVDIAFEQAGRPVICAARNTGAGGTSEVWLYWFKPAVSGFVFEMFDRGRNPRILLDYPPDTTIADVLMFYMKDGSGLVFRQQRDLYGIVLATPVIDTTNLYLEEVVYLEGWRIAAYFSEYKPTKGQYRLRHIESKLYPVPVKDDQMKASSTLLSGEVLLIIIDYVMYDVDQMKATTAIISGLLVAPIILHVLYDIDQMKATAVLQSGILATILIQHVLYDIDQMKAAAAIQSGVLVVVVTQHSLYDIDQMKATSTVQSGTLV